MLPNYSQRDLISQYHITCNERGELVFVGHSHSGSGFDFDTLGKIYEKLEKIKVDSCPIRYVPYTNRDPVWVRPELVAEVKFHG
jgi:bifunctional non-homologous end joining protein LigD